MTQIPDHFNSVGPGWRQILEKLHRELMEIFPDYQIGQVKEKFGGLRVYINNYPENGEVRNSIFEAIAAAEDGSFIICERCGSTNSVDTRGPGWIKTLCDGCREDVRK